ncbi:MAG: hypothetical protein IPO52_13505 [Gemmatimonadetes bacterium]|nr:hypothetical protein [Gemmatimonadota bacterium]
MADRPLGRRHRTGLRRDLRGDLLPAVSGCHGRRGDGGQHLLRSLGTPLSVAVTAASLSTDVLDKTAAFLVVGALLRALPRRILGRFPLGAKAVGR